MYRKLSEPDAQQLIYDYIAGISKEELSIRYNISKGYITEIVISRHGIFGNLWRPDNILGIVQNRKFAFSVGNCKLTKEQAQSIIYEFISGKTYQKLANEYELSRNCVYNIIRGFSWIDLDRPVEAILYKIKENKEKFGWAAKKHAKFPDLTQEQLEIITGSLLGDGSFSKKIEHVQCRFVVGQCIKNKEYVQWYYDKLLPYSIGIHNGFINKKFVYNNGKFSKQDVPKTHNSYVLHTIHHPIFTSMERKWYARDFGGEYIYRINSKGKKVRIKILPKKLELTPLNMAVWFCDDGSNDFKSRRASICTQSFTFGEVEILKNLFSKFNILPVIHKVKSQYSGKIHPILRICGEDYCNFIEIIKPFVTCECLQYKVKSRKKKINKGNCIITKDIIEQSINLRNKGEHWADIANIFNVSITALHAACSGKSHKWLDIPRLTIFPHKTKINMEIAKEILALFESGVKVKDISSKFGIEKYVVYDILQGRTWREKNG